MGLSPEEIKAASGPAIERAEAERAEVEQELRADLDTEMQARGQ